MTSPGLEEEDLKDIIEGEVMLLTRYMRYVENVLDSTQKMALLMAADYGYQPHEERENDAKFDLFKRLMDIVSFFHMTRVIGHRIQHPDGTITVSRDFLCALTIATDHLVQAMNIMKADRALATSVN